MSVQNIERIIITGVAIVLAVGVWAFVLNYFEEPNVARIELQKAQQEIAQLQNELEATRHVIAELETLPEHGPKEHWLLLILAIVSCGGFMYLKTKLDWMRDDVTKLFKALKMKPPNRQPPDDDLS